MNKRSLIVLTFCSFGVLCSLLLALGMQQLIVFSSQKQFVKDASAYANALELGLARRMDDLKAVQGLFEVSGSVDRQAFHRFIERILEYKDRAFAVQWLPRRRDLPADAVGLDGFTLGYSFPAMDALYPMSPDEGIRDALSGAIRQLQEDGQPRVMVHTHADLEADSLHSHDLDFLLPVVRDRELIGLVRGRAEIWFVLEHYLQSAFPNPSGIDILLFGNLDNGQRQAIYRHFSRMRSGHPDEDAVTENLLRRQFHYSRLLQFGHQEFHLMMIPWKLADYSSFQQWYPFAILVLGMGVTLVSSIYLHFYLQNALRLRRLAEERVAALQESQSHFQQLKESEQRYRSVTESAQDGIVIFDAERIVHAWNKGAHTMFGYGPEEMIGRPITAVIHEEGPEELPCIARKERIGRRKDGATVPLEMTGAAWMAGDRRFFTCIIRDVSGWKRLLDELRFARETEARANQAKSVFLATMSHEIRTPLNGILGMTELLMTAPLAPEQREQLRVIAESGKNLLFIINNILDFSKIEAGKLELEEVDFELHHLVDTLTVMFGELARKKGLTLEKRILPGTLRRVRGDSHRLNQILTNLLGNAVKFTATGGVVLEVETRMDAGGHELRLEVRDTGVGMAPEQIAYLFQPFTQADSTTTRRFGGTGLGLSITKRLTELMGGTIQVTSQPGQGSTFRLLIPCVLPKALLDPLPPTDATPAGGVRNARVLLVEDDLLNQVVLKGMLIRCGVTVTVAANGQEALEMLENDRFEMVFMDCHMPVLDGPAAAVRWRAREKELGRPVLPVIALTALATATDRDHCLRAGMSDFLGKPATLGQLEETLRAWLPEVSTARL
ncbi:MAG: PAS domain S-box protein [Magnetococcales bacterium]|nr:PAS domain S-box protein [Magnetococcales bacterium]